ncbi:tetratricopeptide repeat protein [Candidatus Sumerlaeota bacterium]|nr:tetratricopeptide repeat protein [Candidatus Sumerlaeota bacterium]
MQINRMDGGRGGRQSCARKRAALLLLALLGSAILGCKGKSEDERIQEAEKMLQEKNILGATIQYKDFIKKFPDSPHALMARFGLARCYFMDRDYVKSREVLDEVVQKSGGVDTQTGLNAVVLKLETYQQEDKLAEALDECVKTSASLKTVGPEFYQYFMLRTAGLFAMNNRADDAIAVYQGLLSKPAIKTNTHMDALRGIALLYRTSKEPDKAIQAYETYLANNPNLTFPINVGVQFDLGVLLFGSDRKEEGNKHFDEAEQLLTKTIDETVGADEKSKLYFQLAQIKDVRGNKIESRAVIQKVIDDYPMGQYRPSAMMMLSDSLYQDGQTSQALALLDAVKTGYPNSPIALSAFRRAQEIRVKGANGGTSGTLTAPSAPPSVQTPVAAVEPPAAAAEAPKAVQ